MWARTWNGTSRSSSARTCSGAPAATLRNSRRPPALAVDRARPSIAIPSTVHVRAGRSVRSSKKKRLSAIRRRSMVTSMGALFSAGRSSRSEMFRRVGESRITRISVPAIASSSIQTRRPRRERRGMRPSIRATLASVPGPSSSATARPYTATWPLARLTSTRSMLTRRLVRASSRHTAVCRTISGRKLRIATPTEASVRKTTRAITQAVRRRITSALSGSSIPR